MNNKFLDLYAGMSAEFQPDTVIYMVYSTETDLTLDKIPAMTLIDSKGDKCYRLNAPYFTCNLCSTDLLDKRYLNTWLQLKTGMVSYFADKPKALEVAKTKKAQMLSAKTAEITALQGAVKRLRSTRIAFE